MTNLRGKCHGGQAVAFVVNQLARRAMRALLSGSVSSRRAEMQIGGSLVAKFYMFPFLVVRRNEYRIAVKSQAERWCVQFQLIVINALVNS